MVNDRVRGPLPTFKMAAVKVTTCVLSFVVVNTTAYRPEKECRRGIYRLIAVEKQHDCKVDRKAVDNVK